jgi:hypothetical protein
MRTRRARFLFVHAVLSIPTAKPYELRAAFRALVSDLQQHATNLKKALITIRSSEPVFEPICSLSAVRETEGGFCARNCARMTTFLLISRELATDRQKSRFSLVNRLFFETKGNVLKWTISES